MASPAQMRIYTGTPEQQHEAYLSDSADAAQYGWAPVSLEESPVALRVIYEQRGQDALVPSADEEPASTTDRLPTVAPRTPQGGRWEPVLVGALLGVLILVVWALFVYKPGQMGLDGASRTVSAVAHCSPASAALLATIESGLTVPGGIVQPGGQTVKSGDHDGIYFVAASISGVGMNAIVGLWAANDLSGGGSIYSVDSTAKKVSNWPDGGATNAHLSELDSGADVAVACADG
jgi:hypothetical protein